ncbi:hypothetical protein PA10_00174 [Pseudomonas phage pPa_SNUABM_DT01]|nr:hypothetical protein PA10_00174 [Pseudomonas phage pPa_SNUABM_DT01]
MPLEILDENLWAIQADTRVITVNMVGAMGAGVARTARNTIPGLYKHYRKMITQIEPTQFITYQHDGIRYLLIPTKLDWRDPSPRGLVVHNFCKLVVLANRHRLGTIVLPPMGCGNGQLDWENDIQYLYKSLLPYQETKFIAALGDMRSRNGRS